MYSPPSPSIEKNKRRHRQIPNKNLVFERLVTDSEAPEVHEAGHVDDGGGQAEDHDARTTQT